MRRLVVDGYWVAALSVLGACGSDEAHAREVEACAARGVAYFKEIGSYPTLSAAPNAGRSAEDVAIERCNRTTTAF
jgi:hypothetical protein